MPKTSPFRAGDCLEVVGSLDPQTANGLFQQKRLTIQAVRRVELKPSSVKFWQQFLYRKIWQIKNSLLEEIKPLLSVNDFALVKGMVLGGSDQLSPKLKAAFQVTGLTHVVSASGYNLSVISGVVLMILVKFLPRNWAGLGAILVIWLYALMAELTPPIKRAAVMLSLNLLAKRVFYRQYYLKFSLVMSAGLLLLFEPYLIRSLSFCLSMLATCGIILILPRLTASQGIFFRYSVGETVSPRQDFGGNELNHQQKFQQRSRHNQLFTQELAQINRQIFDLNSAKQESNLLVRFWGGIKESFLLTVAAQALTLPLLALVFKEVSWLSFLVNPLLLWLTPFVTLSGLALMILLGLIEMVGLGSELYWLELFLSSLVRLPSQLFLQGVLWFGQFKNGLITF